MFSISAVYFFPRQHYPATGTTVDSCTDIGVVLPAGQKARGLSISGSKIFIGMYGGNPNGSGGSTITRCDLATASSATNCVVQTGINPAGTVIQQLIQTLDGIITDTGGNFMYITSQNGDYGGVWRCDFVADTISNCIRQPTLTSYFGDATQGAILGNSFYLPFLTSDPIMKCPINLDGTLASCASSGSSGQSGSESIAFNSDGSFVYLADTLSASVSLSPYNQILDVYADILTLKSPLEIMHTYTADKVPGRR
jgi:hypothetical protein